MQLLRNEDGSWHKYQAESPCGAAVDIYIANDKSPKQRRVETTTKRLGRVFESLYPNLKVFVNRRKGTISHQWVDIAKIEAPRRDEDVKLFFKDAKMSEY
eukprot:11732362-Karenia_brevis.AAC.1